jgi:site-specific recombinase XerD
MAQKPITLSRALEGYFLHAHARRLSPSTLDSYDWAYHKLEDHLRHDPPLAAITPADIRTLFNSLTHLSSKSLLNIHIAFSALWTWAVNEALVERNIMRSLTPPKPEKRDIVPFTKRDVQLMLSACDRSQGYTRPGKRKSNHRRPTAKRDRAILVLLVDTGLRASELCNLCFRHADLDNQRIIVMGKGNKERYVPIDSRTGQVLWRYLATREDRKPTAPLFATASGRPMDRTALGKLIGRIGQRAGILHAHPHRFRHTFAVNFLRNGGNVFALQRILGHTSLEMVQRYLAIAQADVDKAHRQASPVANWLL